MDASDFLAEALKHYESATAEDAGKNLTSLISSKWLVGDLLKIDYGNCDVLVHDYHRREVGGVPLGCFLLATRLQPGAGCDAADEDACLILLRVVGQSKLPNATETDIAKLNAGQRASDTPETWDAEGKTDKFTLHLLRYSGVNCRILGTFRMRLQRDKWRLVFGADISNFYSGRGMKIYKPVEAALSVVVNFARSATDDSHPLYGNRVPVGRVRYAAAEVAENPPEGIDVSLDPTDLIARRTALFGMSRTGKSNTTKVIAASVFRLRSITADLGRVGQLVFDVNGEYANENAQDAEGENAACLKNVVAHTPGAKPDDVVTYGLMPHPNDPNRQMVKINFFGSDPGNQRDWQDVAKVSAALESLLVGKIAVDSELAVETSKYITAFRNTPIDPPPAPDVSEATRYRRRIFVYRTVLAAAGFRPPRAMQTAHIRGLFGQELRDALRNNTSQDPTSQSEYLQAGIILDKEAISWDEAATVCRALRKFMADNTAGYSVFNQNYMRTHDGRGWADDNLIGLLAIFEYPAGVRLLRGIRPQHDPEVAGDFARQVVEHLRVGRLVIVDQSVGDPEMNKTAASRIMWELFNAQKLDFVQPKKRADGTVIPPPDVLVYAEEAHNLLPKGSETDVQNIWSRAAKEGSKYRIGLVYATQEPSSIQANILKNTDNWFVAHLNNADEIRELRKYYDFEDFAGPILQVPEPGFIRMRTLSNPYIVPIQVKRFRVSEAAKPPGA